MSLQEYVNEQFVGQDKSKQQILDEIYKAGKDAHKDVLGYVPMKPMALITVHNPKSSIIESIGFSEPDDILTNIFGACFSGMLNSGGTVNRNVQDVNGAVRTLFMNQSSNDNYCRTFLGTCGVKMQVGRGGGSFLRSDFQLDDPFVVAPESNPFNITSGGWISGNQQVITNGLLSGVTTSDVIGECGLIARWRDGGAGASFDFLISHDLAGSAFTGGQNVNVTYTWSIT